MARVIQRLRGNQNSSGLAHKPYDMGEARRKE